MITDKARKTVHDRSDRMCEAMIRVGHVWTRCGLQPVELHHLLTRARGGDALDRVGETYHLIALCHLCHRNADGGDAYLGDLLIEGYAAWDDQLNRPVYTGPDKYLSTTYGRKP